MKLLIDALYINESGGLRLLEYLVASLQERGVEFHLVADLRCKGHFDALPSVEYMKASMGSKASLFNRDLSEYTSLLCFGNIPPTKRLKIPVYTYFHNINLLTLAEAHSLSVKMKSWLKREVFKHYKQNTNYWLVQTSNTANELLKNLREKPDRVKLLPFYELPEECEDIAQQQHGKDYVFVALHVPGKSHEELLGAWYILHSKGIDKTLHLTVQEESPFCEKIKEAQIGGVNVVNHGVIPFKEVFDLYKQSKAIIYPSHNESLGLGIVEAVTSGCDVIGSDLPFLHSICKPSAVFNPFSTESIAEAVMKYENGGTDKSELLIHNQIDELIELISNN
jgi:glycosyltransferase involved in cell wall biosynthesis